MININNKPWDKVRKSDIIEHLNKLEEETFFFELKCDEVASDHFIKEVSALANTYGGYIFLGVDDNKQIKGCRKWTEQRIHSVMHDCITPTPNFDVKSFKIEEHKIFVVKVEEGIAPPYITNKGNIYERISSGTFVIKDSSRLSQIYYKNEKQLKNIEQKLSIEPIPLNNQATNLCAYLDFGFSTNYSEPAKLQKGFFTYDFDSICNYLDSTQNEHSISRLGSSIVISYGELMKDSGDFFVAGLHNFMEIMLDGSVKGRIILPATTGKSSTLVDIYSLIDTTSVFENIYRIFFDETYFKNFCSAYKYEKLTVLKQFTPYYKMSPNSSESKIFNDYLINHKKKFGNNLIISSNRTPAFGFRTIDKTFFDNNQIPYNYTNLIKYLFPNSYVILGYIDPIKRN